MIYPPPQRDRERGRETERQRDKETEKQRDRKTDRQRDRETKRQRDRQTDSETDRRRTYFRRPVCCRHGLLSLAVTLEDEGGRLLDEGRAFGHGLEPDRAGGLILDEGQLGLELFERTNNN